ncbi:hypothetical protein HPG69_008178 [Diceros bicornis minor]|uniref:Uncharacterized protein n=1 Tax=Diceros bicornis minor TaxID=77932 RepID=A0A7J7E6Y2_DICBM|nr:hypothetical protein HPG69_008178 [Diceros bicornis minor]
MSSFIPRRCQPGEEQLKHNHDSKDAAEHSSTESRHQLHRLPHPSLFVLVFACFEYCLLATIAYNQSVVICHPLMYIVIMNPHLCGILILLSLGISIVNVLFHSLMALQLSFCTDLEIPHFCEIVQVIKLTCSYSFINTLMANFMARVLSGKSGMSFLSVGTQANWAMFTSSYYVATLLLSSLDICPSCRRNTPFSIMVYQERGIEMMEQLTECLQHVHTGIQAYVFPFNGFTCALNNHNLFSSPKSSFMTHFPWIYCEYHKSSHHTISALCPCEMNIDVIDISFLSPVHN